jgi:hypothetical protein
MRDSTLESKMVFIRAAQRDALSQMPQVGVIDRSADFVDADGHFIEKGKINGKLRTLRTGDGVHLMPVAADLLVDAFARMLAPSTVETAPAPSSGTSAGAASAASAPALATSPGQN